MRKNRNIPESATLQSNTKYWPYKEEAPSAHIVQAGPLFAQRERARVGLSPMLDISQHRSRKGTPP